MSQNQGYPFGNPYVKDYGILVSILGLLPYKGTYKGYIGVVMENQVEHEMETRIRGFVGVILGVIPYTANITG